MADVIDAVAAANPPKALAAVTGNAAAKAAANAAAASKKKLVIAGVVVTVIIIVVVIVVAVTQAKAKEKEAADAKAKSDAAAAKAAEEAKAKTAETKPAPAPAPAPAAPATPAPAPAAAPAAQPAVQFDKSCVNDALIGIWGDAPFIGKYTNWLQTVNPPIQTLPSGSQCPANYRREQIKTDKCIICTPEGVKPQIPDDLQKDMNAWFAKKQEAAIKANPRVTHPDSLLNGEVLAPGEVMRSKNGRYIATMQTDGNFVVYKGNQALWALQSVGVPCCVPGRKAIMQTDNNFVIYNANGTPAWATGTNAKGPGQYIVMQDDGNLVMYNSNGQPTWASNTAGR